VLGASRLLDWRLGCVFADFPMAALHVEILGTGCKKCQQLEANAKEAIAGHQLTAEVAHITDAMEIVKRGVMRTPALIINGKLLSQGKVLEPSEIGALLPEA
jgi:small redox-active disulfide protein 2